jgi:hypothetical protein
MPPTAWCGTLWHTRAERRDGGFACERVARRVRRALMRTCAALLFFLVLIGCGSSDGATSEPAATDTPAPVSSAPLRGTVGGAAFEGKTALAHADYTDVRDGWRVQVVVRWEPRVVGAVNHPAEIDGVPVGTSSTDLVEALFVDTKAGATHSAWSMTAVSRSWTQNQRRRAAMATSACARPPTKATKSKAKSPSKCAPCPPTANPPTRVRLGQPDPGSCWPTRPGFVFGHPTRVRSGRMDPGSGVEPGGSCVCPNHGAETAGAEGNAQGPGAVRPTPNARRR